LYISAVLVDIVNSSLAGHVIAPQFPSTRLPASVHSKPPSPFRMLCPGGCRPRARTDGRCLPWRIPCTATEFLRPAWTPPTWTESAVPARP